MRNRPSCVPPVYTGDDGKSVARRRCMPIPRLPQSHRVCIYIYNIIILLYYRRRRHRCTFDGGLCEGLNIILILYTIYTCGRL